MQARQLQSSLMMSAQNHLIINSQNVHNVNPDVDDVDLAGEGKIKLVVVSGQTEMFGERDILVTKNLLLGSIGAGKTAVLKHLVDKHGLRRLKKRF